VSEERKPTYEELQARVFELGELLKHRTNQLDRLVLAESPRDKVIFGLVRQLSIEFNPFRWSVQFVEGDQLVRMAAEAETREGEEFDRYRKFWRSRLAVPVSVDFTTMSGAAVLSRSPIPVEDLQDTNRTDYPVSRELYQSSKGATGIEVRSGVSIPLVLGGEVVGVLTLDRMEVRPFTDADIAVIQPYADQMALAIGQRAPGRATRTAQRRAGGGAGASEGDKRGDRARRALSRKPAAGVRRHRQYRHSPR
jgi:GAF domain-containing protein